MFSMILIAFSILLIKNYFISYGKAINKFCDIILLTVFIAVKDFSIWFINLFTENFAQKFKIELKIKDKHEFYRPVLLQCQMV